MQELVTRLRAAGCVFAEDEARLLIAEARTAADLGASVGSTSHPDFATFAYNASTGVQLWGTRYDGPANDDDGANSIAVSPNGTRVFVTGWVWGPTSNEDYATVAYAA